jgi:hypothetical protein
LVDNAGLGGGETADQGGDERHEERGKLFLSMRLTYSLGEEEWRREKKRGKYGVKRPDSRTTR